MPKKPIYDYQMNKIDITYNEEREVVGFTKTAQRLNFKRHSLSSFVQRNFFMYTPDTVFIPKEPILKELKKIMKELKTAQKRIDKRTFKNDIDEIKKLLQNVTETIKKVNEKIKGAR